MTPPQTLTSLLESRTKVHSNKLFARFLLAGDVDGEVRCWTYGQLHIRVRAIAAALAAQTRPTDRALLLFPPGLDYVASFFACLEAGVVAVPAYPPDPTRLQQTLPRLQAILRDAAPTVVISLAPIAEMAGALAELAPELAALPWLSADTVPDHTAAGWSSPVIRPSDVAFIQYTSGSTGEPKGVVLTHENLLANSRMIRTGFGNRGPDEHGVSWLPMFHDMGLIGNVIQPIDLGCSMTYLSPLDFLKRPMRWMRAISTFGGTISGAPDFAYALCARRASDADVASLDLSRWRVAYSGAEPVRPTSLEAFCTRFAPSGFQSSSLIATYGLAEATLMVTARRHGIQSTLFDADSLAEGTVKPSTDGRTIVSCGEAVEGGEVAVVDPVTLARTHHEGEVLVRGPHVARGYHGRPAATAATFGVTIPGDTGGPWLRTGDLGFLHGGGLYLTGRIKDLIVLRGRNHYPQDIEATVEHAFPGIRPGCVAAFSVESGGEERVVVVAELVGDPDAAAAAVRSAVANGHGIQLFGIAFVARRTIPKTSSGKIQRRACKAAWLTGTLETVGSWAPAAAPEATPAAPPATHRALDCVTDWLMGNLTPRPASIDPQHTFAAVGLDSVAAASLAAHLEDTLGLDVPVELFFGHTVQEAADILGDGIQRRAQGGGTTLAIATVDLDAVGALDPTIQPGPPGENTHPTTLLTGATGFLGAYLLSELWQGTPDDLLCVVRANDPTEGLARVRKNLRRYDLWRPEMVRRLRVITGDLESPRLGLSADRFEALAHQITRVVHNGARIHWAAPYSALAAANVCGTTELLRMASVRSTPFHFVSSLGVFPVGTGTTQVFREQGPLTDGAHIRLGYFLTKYVAEKRLEAARERGLPIAIYRPGFITGDSRTGAGADDPHQLLPAFLGGALALGSAPDLDKVIDASPVDFVARAITTLATTPESLGTSFNLLNPQPLRQQDLYHHVRAMGWELGARAFPRWRERVLALDPKGDNPLVRFQGWYRAMDTDRMQRLEVLMRDRLPIEDRAATDALTRAGVHCAPFDSRLLHLYLQAWVAAGTVPPPPGHQAGTPLARPTLATVPPAEPAVVDHIDSHFGTAFLGDYAREEERLVRLYERGKKKQWNAADRIDWSIDLDPENPQELPDVGLPIYGSALFEKMNRTERANLRRHYQAWQTSQFLHGEQGALLCASKIVQQAPSMDAKLYAATQVVDEARHLEAFDRLLTDKLELRYPVTRPLKKLLDDVISDRRWDMTYLGMQVLVEGLALAAFATVRDMSRNPLSQQLHAYVMEDEARHVAFGRLVLQNHYPQLTNAERDEREEFVVEACYLLRDRFLAIDVFEQLGLPVDAALAHMQESGFFRTYRAELFSRLVPTVKAIGLWGPRVQEAFAHMGVLGFARVDLDQMMREDEAAAGRIDDLFATARGTAWTPPPTPAHGGTPSSSKHRSAPVPQAK